MESRDYLRLSAEDFAQLENYEIQRALQQMAGCMAVCQAEMRDHQEGHYAYLAAKESFAFLKSTATTLQTLIRSS